MLTSEQLVRRKLRANLNAADYAGFGTILRARLLRDPLSEEDMEDMLNHLEVRSCSLPSAVRATHS